MRKDGSRFWADGVMTVIRDASGQQIGFLKIMHDITEQKLVETEHLRLANFDSLTGLANRRRRIYPAPAQRAFTAGRRQPGAYP